MAKIDKTIVRETCYITGWVIIFSVIMQLIYIVLGFWSYKVITGNLLTGAVSVLNFLLMGITVQNAINKEQKEAKNAMKASQGLRTVMLFAAVALGVALPWFDVWASIIPLFFPRIAILIRPLFDKK